MKRIEQQKPGFSGLAMKALAWITSADRQLTTVELQHALATDVDASELDTDKIVRIKRVISVCAGLVKVNEENSIIQLVHYTTQEYFEQTRATWFPNAHYNITRACVTYLLFRAFETGPCQSDHEFEARLKSNQFYQYAAWYWGHHARRASGLHPKVLGFLKCPTNVDAAAQALFIEAPYYSILDYSPGFPRKVTGLHLVAYFGIEGLVSTFLQSVDLESKDSGDKTPLSYAAENGHEAVVKLLLEAKADIDSKDNGDQTPLSYAAKNGYEAAVKLLLEAKADIESEDIFGRTPLSHTAKNGNEAVVKLLQSRRLES